MRKTKEELKQVFNDTKRKAWIGNFVSTKTKKFKEQSVTIKENIIVEPTDTVTAATKYAELGKTCVLNMASAKTAGGGVADGETAQEECLFRCSNLGESITQDLYPLEESDALYTKNAIFFKDKDYNDMKMVKVDVVTVAAVNLNLNSRYDENIEKWIDGITPKPADYYALIRTKIRTMLSLASKNKCKYIILGAWGCGVFKNEPYEIADAFYGVLVDEEYERLFEQVVFAIINDNNSVANNIEIFKEVLVDY
jgi:uncharacterized protein (TIGR02452 family)